MATDTITPPDEDQDAIQQHYDDAFDQLTSAEHQAKSGVPGDIGNDDEAGFYKGGDDEPKAGKAKDKEGGNEKKPGAGDDDAPGFVKGELGGLAGGVATGGVGAAISGFFKGKWSRRKSVTTGVMTLVIGGSALFGLNIASGPFEFIHLAKLLEGFHFSAQEDQSDLKVGRLSRYIRDPSKPQNLRMSKLANKYADRFEARLNASGIESRYTKIFGFGEGYEVNRDNEKWKGLSDEQVKAKLNAELGVPESAITIKGKDGPVTFDVGNGYFKNAELNQGILKAVGYSKISAWMGNRMLIRRAGVTLHPFHAADNKVLKSADKFIEWQKERKAGIDNGAEAEQVVAENAKDKNGNSTGNQNSNDAIDTVTSTEGEATTAGNVDTPGPVQAFQDHLTTKIAGGGAAVVGIACLVKSVNDAATNEKQAKVVLPLIRFGTTAMSAGGQLMASMDVNGDEVKYMHDLMYGKDAQGNVTSWADAQSIQAMEGKTGGVAPSDTLTSIAKGGPFDKFFNATGVGPVMGAACSTAGTIIMTGFSLATGPISTIIGGVTSYFLEGKVVSWLAHWFIGQPIDPFATGADFGSQADYGSLLAANDMAMASGGVALSSSQVAALQNTSDSLQNSDFAHQSFAYRIFNPKDPQTLASKLIDNSSATTHNVASVADIFTGLPHSFASSLGGLFGLSKARAAAAPYDYGFPIYGFSAQDMEDPLMTQPYSGAGKLAGELLDGPNSDSYISKAQSCFGATIQKDTDGDWEVNANTDAIDAYSGKYDNAGCSDSGKDWLAIRGFISYSETMDAMACWEGEAESCQNIGAAQEPSQNTGNGGTSFRIASYNILGASHDSNWQPRADDVINTVTSNGIDVIGAQEIQEVQRNYIVNKLGYGVFPSLGSPNIHYHTVNSILWNTNNFNQIGKGGYITGLKYFCGSALEAPYVKLQSKTTQQEFYVINTHDPATNAGPACSNPEQNRAERTANARIYAAFIKDLKQKTGLPVFMTGDFNNGYDVTGSGANSPLNGQASNLTLCIMEQGGQILDAYDSFRGRDPECPNPVAPQDHDRIGGGVDHVFLTTDASVTDWQTIPGNQAGTDHDALQIYGITLPDTGADDSSGDNGAGDIVPSACYTVTRQNLNKTEGKMLHWNSGIPINSYPKEDSPAGIKYAASHGFTSIDLDIQMTKDGVPVVTHWAKPFIATYGMPQPFYDPDGKLPKNTTISQMTFAEVSRLQNRDGQSQILSLDQMIQVASQNGVNLSIEFKTNGLIKALPEITGALNTYKVKAYIKANAQSFEDSLVAARKFGFWTRGTLGSEGAKAPDSCHVGGS